MDPYLKDKESGEIVYENYILIFIIGSEKWTKVY